MSDEDDSEKASDGERRIANMYRRERQKSDAAKLGIEPIDPKAHFGWLAANEDLLAKAARAGGATDAEVPEFIKSYKQSMQDDPEGSEYDDPHAMNIINRVVKKVEAICNQSQIPIRNGVVFGVTPSFGLIANQSPVLTTDASIIGLSVPFFVFCAAVTKAMAKSLVSSRIENHLLINNRPEDVRHKLRSEPDVVQFWVRILRDFGCNIWPPNLQEPPLNADEGTIRALLLQGVELFSVAHEYGHHVLKHGLVTSSADPGGAFDQEHDADVFARIICLLNEKHELTPNLFSSSGAAAAVILGSLDLVRRATALFATGNDTPTPRKSHPPFRDRIAHIADVDQLATEQERPALSTRRNNFSEIVGIVWSEVRPHLLRLYNEGQRATTYKSEAGGWLPLA